jgi:hypothetical protein
MYFGMSSMKLLSPLTSSKFCIFTVSTSISNFITILYGLIEMSTSSQYLAVKCEPIV